MPDGQPAPVSHQHADDTSLHVLEPRDAQVALDTSIGLFCAASCSQLNAGKSQAFLVQAQPLASATVSTLPSISFITGQQTIKHLGVRFFFFFFFWVTGEMSIPFRQAAVKDARRT
ncbi:hypothetical protein ABBQ32_008095 [Trebouxia sp. C0010 RCD-2024]